MQNKGFYIEVEVESSKGKQFYYCSDSNIRMGDYVLVETSFANEVGVVSKDPKKDNEKLVDSFNEIIRVCDELDVKRYLENKQEAIEAGKIFNQYVEKLSLNMKLVNAIYAFDKSKILFSYVSEERVDFRELLKELSPILKCRIELKQIGPRDRSKIVGGIGICGLPLCCKSFLNEFEGVSINMAKNQFLALNIQKLSGQCGKLLCCLKYEDDEYTELRKDAPKYGLKFKSEGVDYKITAVNLLSKTVKVESLDKEIIKTINFDEVNEMMKK